jgi:hypothetical protein
MPGAEKKLESNNNTYPITVQPTLAGIAWHMAEALDNLVPRPLSLILRPSPTHRGTVAEWLWRHV